MDMKIALGSIAALGALVGGAMLAGRLGAGDSGPGQLSEPAALQRPQASAADQPQDEDTLVIDERDLILAPEGAEFSHEITSGFQHDGGRFVTRSVVSGNLLERFDADGDGVLSDEERKASHEVFRAEREARRQQWLLEQYDANGDSVLSATELARQEADETARAEARAERITKAEQLAIETYDLDGDGALADDEKEAARHARREYMARQHEAMQTLFDADGDGSMTQAERTTMHDTMGQMFGEMRFVRSFDSNGDRAVTTADMPAYMDLFLAADGRADIDGNGVVNEADLADFQRRALTPPSPALAQAMAWFRQAPPPVDVGQGQFVIHSGAQTTIVTGTRWTSNGPGGGHMQIQAEVILEGGGGSGGEILVIERYETRDD